MKHDWELLWAMTEREIKARYKHAILGFLWIILNPILQMVVIGVAFSFVLKVNVADYFLFLFSGLLSWNFFSLTLLKVTPSIVYELALIEKAKFPREVIVLSIVLSNMFHTIISFLLYAVVLALLGRLQLERMIYLPLIFVWLVLLVTGFGLLTSALNVRFRDISFIVQAIVPLWFYASPILYSIEMVPIKYRLFLDINPLTAILSIAQWVFLNKPLPGAEIIFFNVLTACSILILGFFVFKRESLYFDDWV